MRQRLPRAGIVFMLAGAIVAAPAAAQTITSTRVVSGLVRPVFVTHAPNDFTRIFIIEKQGRIRIAQITAGGAYTLLAPSFLDIDALVTGGTMENDERGLLGLAFHPNYPSDPRFYVNYTGTIGTLTTVIAEYTVSANPNIANTTGNIMLTYTQPQTNHNGGWIGFGPNDDYLYIASGDGGNFNDQGAGHTEPNGNGLDTTNMLLGKILRIDVNGDDFPADANRDYTIPPTNPFVGVTGDDEIWAFGLRNPWRPSFDRMTGDFYIADVGQNDWEEINVQLANAADAAGRNYGWRCREGMHNTGYPNTTCTGWTFTEPIHEYGHGIGCSITGGYVYRGCAIASLQGYYFYADYCANRVWSFQYNGAVVNFSERTAQLAPGGGLSIASITSFGEDAFGEIYLTDSTGGEVFKIIPVGAPTPDCNTNGRNDACDIRSGASADANANGIPDECEPGVCPGDVDGDGDTDLADLAALLAAFGTATGDPQFNPNADLDPNGVIDLADLTILLSDFGCA